MQDGGLRRFGPDLWIAEGPVVPFHGFSYPTRMAVIRLPDRELFLWSPIALASAPREAIDALGSVRHLVSPNTLHHLFLAEWKATYPSARLYAPPGLRKKRPDLPFDADLGDVAEPEWRGEIDQVAMRGSVAMTEIVFFHRKSRTAIFGDLIENFSSDWFRGWRGLVARLGGIAAPNGSAPIDWRLTFLHRRSARAALGRILAWPVERVVIAHGEPAETDGIAFIRRGFRWLLGRGGRQLSG